MNDIDRLLSQTPPDRLRKIVSALATRIAAASTDTDAKSIVAAAMAGVGEETAEEKAEREKRKWSEARSAELAAKADRVRDDIRNGDKPILTGTPKQIAWAMEIRAEEMQKDPYNREFKRADAKKASWWIDRRTSQR